jgi:putative ABC transport system permease protein
MIRVTFKGILAHKVRFLLTGVAIILGVAFICGTLVFTATINKAFDGLFTNVYANTDAVVREKATFQAEGFGSVRGRVDSSLIPEVRRTAGVAEADGTVTGFAWVVDKENEALNKSFQGPPALGFSWSDSRELSSFHLADFKGETSRPPSAPDQVVIDRNTLEKAEYTIGDTVPIVTQTGRADYQVVGAVVFGDADSLLGATSVLFTPRTASRVLGEPGKVDEIAVKADPGVSQAEVVRNIEETLRGTRGIEVLTGEQITTQNQNDIKDQLSFFNTFLLVFGFIALIVGSFIIFNTFSIIVAQRAREMALLRAIGAKGSQVVWSVLLEAALVGVVASALGFVVGILLATGVKAALTAAGIDLPTANVTVPPSALIMSFAVGLIVTIVAAVAPALRASRIPPIAALHRVGADQSPGGWRRVVIGISITLLGIALLLGGLFGDSGNALSMVGLGAFIVFLGVALLGPLIARPVSAVLGWPVRAVKGITGLLAEENAKRNPKRTAATAAALMIGVALVGLITVFGASARASVRSGIDQAMKSDYVINSGGFGFGTLPRVLEEQLRATPGVTQVSGTQSGAIEVDGGADLVLGVEPGVVDSLFDLQVSDGSLPALRLDGIAVKRSKADDEGWQVGDEVRVLFPAGNRRTFTIQAIFDQTQVPTVPNYVISTAAFAANYPNVFDSAIYVNTEGGTSRANRAALERTLEEYPNGELKDRAEFKQQQTQQIEGFLSFVTALLLFAVFIAVFGIANTLGLSIIERTRELGLMRAVGMTRRQVRSLVRWEAVIIALLGAFLGIVIGVAFGWVIVEALRSEGISEFRAAPVRLFVIFLVAAVFGVLAAILPARRAAKLDVLQAISTE